MEKEKEGEGEGEGEGERGKGKGERGKGFGFPLRLCAFAPLRLFLHRVPFFLAFYFDLRSKDH
jgi:hypothetical protein